MTPLDVVVRILNNQLSSLMWIDEKVRFSINFKLYLLSDSNLRQLNVLWVQKVLQYMTAKST